MKRKGCNVINEVGYLASLVAARVGHRVADSSHETTISVLVEIDLFQ